MSRIKTWGIVVLLTGCASPEKTSERTTASGYEVNKREYDRYRGSGHAKFEYDDHRPAFGTLDNSKVFGNREDRKLARVLSDHRQALFESRLFDTGVDSAAGVDCNKVMKRVHRTPQGRCYFHRYTTDERLQGHLRDQDRHLVTSVMMGSHGQRFGRNFNQGVSNDATLSDIMTPNPLEIS